MSESDVIKVTIDDSELDVALAKIQQIVMLSEEVTATAGGGVGIKGLPGINREMRLILGQIPGMREAIQIYFRLSRITRAQDLAKKKKDLTQLYLTTFATLLVVYQQILQWMRKDEQRIKEYEMWIRRERKITHDEFETLVDQWKNIARNRPG